MRHFLEEKRHVIYISLPQAIVLKIGVSSPYVASYRLYLLNTRCRDRGTRINQKAR